MVGGCLVGGRCLVLGSLLLGGLLPGECLILGGVSALRVGAWWRPPSDGYCCGRYASYRNAFLFENKLQGEISHLIQHSMTDVNLLWNWLESQLFIIYLHQNLYKKSRQLRMLRENSTVVGEVHVLLRRSLNFCSCTTWFLDLNDLVRII